MQVAREDFLAVTALVEPALASKDLMEELTHLWFSGETVTAFNDTICIEAPLQTEFKGGIRGSLLYGLLSNSRAKTVKFLEDHQAHEMRLRAGAMRAKVPLLDPERSFFTCPRLEADKAFKVTQDLLDGLRRVLVSTGTDVSVPDHLGVAFVVEGNILHLYTTDSKTISWARVELPKSYTAPRVCVPTVFCQQILQLCREGDLIQIKEDSVLAETDDGIRMFSRLVNIERPRDYGKILEKKAPSKYRDHMIPIPARLRLAIKRVCVVLESGHPEPVKIALDEEYLKIESISSFGEVRDSIKLEKPHDEIVGHVDPLLIQRSLDVCTEFLMAEECLVMGKSPNYTYLVSRTER